MTFVYPGLLFGLLLGAIPIVVYYLMRFRSLRVPWGADYILERALARRRRKLYWDQIVLLALRALLVMAIVTAFARPQARKTARVSTDGRVLRTILADGSYSLLAGKDNHTRRAAHMEAMRALVSRWGRGETWSLYALDAHPRWVVDQAAVTDAEKSRAILDSLKIEETSVSLAAGLEAVLAHGAGQPREIYIFTDDQASSWEGVEERAALDDGKTRVFWIDPPLADRRNLAVTKLELAHERALKGVPFAAYAQVRNFSDEAVRDAELTFLVDGAVAGSKRISLQPGQSTQVPMDMRLSETGPHLVTARLGNDALAYDNAMSVGVEITDSISLLVLKDAERTGTFESSSGFLRLLAQVLSGGGTNAVAGPLRVAEFTGPECDLQQLDGSDAVVLDGGRTLTANLADTLRRYVERGGALILAADDTVDLRRWRDLLEPAGLLPAIPARVRSDPVGGSGGRSLSRSGFDLPALRELGTGADGDIAQVRFYTWTEFEDADPRADVLARFSDGSPYAWRHRSDLGSVLLLAAGLNCRNNNLLVRETVYPFLLHLVAEAGSAGQYSRRVAPLQPVRYLARGEPPPLGAQFEMEGEEPVPAALIPQQGGTRVDYAAGAVRSGPASMLVLRDGGSERVGFGIQGERTDSNLTPMAPEVRKRLAGTFHWTVVESARELMDALDAQGQGIERYAWFVVAAMLFAMGELLMGLRFV